MADYSLTQLFGANATQSSTELIIKKADLVNVGLTPAANNSAESLVVALFLLWQSQLTDTNRLLDEANRQIAISDAGVDIYQGATDQYLRRTLALSLYNQFTVPVLDPDNF